MIMNYSLQVEALQALRVAQPLVLNITNYVAMDFTANALLAIGASPIMTHAREELVDLISNVGALVLNIGTLDPVWVEAMHEALALAKKRGIPVVLDPVGVHATSYRLAVAESLLNAGGISIIRGNAAEIMALGHFVGKGKGVDSRENTAAAIPAAKVCLAQYGTLVAISGAVDQVVGEHGVWALNRGHPLMTKVTAMGCAASSLIGAFLAVSSSVDVAACTALGVMSLAGEAAMQEAKGPGSLAVHFLDALYNMEAAALGSLTWV